MNNGGTTTRPAPTANYAPGATDGTGNGAQNGNGAAGLTNNANNPNNVNNANNGADGAMNNGSAGNTAATSDGALNPFDWANGAADIEKAIARISEVADARVVVTNSTALVGVKFDNAYKGEITERIREMVAAEVLRADPNIQTVAVTASEDDVNKVYALSEQIRAGRNADELSAEINAIVRNATTLR
jgi:YhcN/YlaJ family sporulation lipoprotein